MVNTDTTKRIIYNSNGKLAVIYPCECGLTIEEIAKKDVPDGYKYKIVDSTSVPNSWDESDYTGVNSSSTIN